MAYNLFESFGLTDDIDTRENIWTEVATKRVSDSDGFMTDYTWYTNGDIHIFMFGDKDLYEPDEDYADWSCETEEEAQEWFDNYHGFDGIDDFEDEGIDEDYHGDADFMNKGFDRVFGIHKDRDIDQSNNSLKSIDNK